MKKGFTLAEILVTMMIIGIVASMTIPTLVKSQQNQKNTAALAKAVNTMSNATSLMIARDGSYGLNDSTMWVEMEGGMDVKTAFETHLGKILIFTDDEISYTAIPKTLYGVEKTSLFNDYTRLTTKAGINYFVKVVTTYVNNDQYDINYDKNFILADVLIDVNGNDAPNTIGKDIYGFLMTNEGRLLPYGGINTTDLVINPTIISTSAGTSSRYTNNWKTKCPDSTKTDSGFCCTRRVVSENYKINY